MIQVLWGLRTQNATGTSYADLMGGDLPWSASEAQTTAPWSAPGVFRNFVLELATAPSPGTRTVTLRINGAPTALTVTLSGSATTARLTGVDVAVGAGDLVVLQHTLASAPASTAGIRWSLEFEGTTPNESGYTGVGGLLGSTGGTRYGGVFTIRGSFSAIAADNRQVVAAAGTLTRTDAAVSSAPGVGNGVTVYLTKNGVRQDGTGGTVNTACALVGAITQTAVTYTLALSPGDLVSTEYVVSGTFSSRTWSLGTAFTATTAGESQVCGSTIGQTLSTSTPIFVNAATVGTTIHATETTFAARMLPGVTTVSLSGLQVLCSAAPGVGKSRLVDLRVSAASVGPTVTISDSATTASDTSSAATLVDGADCWNLRTVPTATPAAMVLMWGLIQGPGTAAPAAAHVQSFVWMPV